MPKKAALLSWLTPLHGMLYTQVKWCVVRSGAQCSGFTISEEGRLGSRARFNGPGSGQNSMWRGDLARNWPNWVREQGQTDE